MLAPWRIFRHWSNQELKFHLEELKNRRINFGEASESRQAVQEETVASDSGRTSDTNPRVPVGEGWTRYYTQAVVGRENPGLPEKNGAFEKAWNAVSLYQFSDPRIVLAHYDTSQPLLGRNMLLEVSALGVRFLCGTRVNFVRDITDVRQSVRGFRYDTLEGHLEAGSEWFLLTKDHTTGDITFQIHASWKYAEFPTWWSKLGFIILGKRYQLAWHRLAYLRLRHLLGSSVIPLAPVPHGNRLVHLDTDPLENSDLWILKDAPTLSQTEIISTSPSLDHKIS